MSELARVWAWALGPSANDRAEMWGMAGKLDLKPFLKELLGAYYMSYSMCDARVQEQFWPSLMSRCSMRLWPRDQCWDIGDIREFLGSPRS